MSETTKNHATYVTVVPKKLMKKYHWNQEYSTDSIAGKNEREVSGNSKTIFPVLNAVWWDLEKFTAVYKTGNMPALWEEPATESPLGWAENITWKWHFPIGLDTGIA